MLTKTPLEKLEEFLSKFRLSRYKKHEIILRAEETPQGVYYLKKGYVRDYAISEEGEELTLIIFKPGDLFPMNWAINNRIFRHYLEAMTLVEIWRAPRDKFLNFIKTHPDVFFEFSRRMLIRMDGLLDRMEHLVFGNAHQKIASILAICAERFGVKKEKDMVVQVPLTHKDIANLVGVTRETASLEIKKLEKEGVVAYCGKNVIIKNLKRLQRESLGRFFSL